MWLILLKKFWPYLVVAGITIFIVHKADALYYNHHEKSALADQEKKLNEQCAADKEITKGVSHDFQSKNAALRADIGRLNKLFDNTCIAVASPAAGYNATAIAGKPVGSYGVNPQALLAYAGDAETYRLQLISCQTFIQHVWKSRGQ